MARKDYSKMEPKEVLNKKILKVLSSTTLTAPQSKVLLEWVKLYIALHKDTLGYIDLSGLQGATKTYVEETQKIENPDGRVNRQAVPVDGGKVTGLFEE